MPSESSILGEEPGSREREREREWEGKEREKTSNERRSNRDEWEVIVDEERTACTGDRTRNSLYDPILFPTINGILNWRTNGSPRGQKPRTQMKWFPRNETPNGEAIGQRNCVPGSLYLRDETTNDERRTFVSKQSDKCSLLIWRRGWKGSVQEDTRQTRENEEIRVTKRDLYYNIHIYKYNTLRIVEMIESYDGWSEEKGDEYKNSKYDCTSIARLSIDGYGKDREKCW